MHTLIFATNNRNKVAEIQSLVGANFTIIPLKEAGIEIDIPEPHDQLEANAHEKAVTIFNLTHQNCLLKKFKVISHFYKDLKQQKCLMKSLMNPKDVPL